MELTIQISMKKGGLQLPFRKVAIAANNDNVKWLYWDKFSHVQSLLSGFVGPIQLF